MMIWFFTLILTYFAIYVESVAPSTFLQPNVSSSQFPLSNLSTTSSRELKSTSSQKLEYDSTTILPKLEITSTPSPKTTVHNSPAQHKVPKTSSQKLNNSTKSMLQEEVSTTLSPTLEVPTTLPQNLANPTTQPPRYEDDESTTLPPELDEDQRVINETFAKYGSFKDYTKLELPGPELVDEKNDNDFENNFTTDGPGKYTLRVRTVTKHFSYNGRYEKTETKTIGEDEITVTKGQFGEHFERKNGGFYIRTIGYTLDENGYQQFVINLSTAKTTTQRKVISVISKRPGTPVQKIFISSTLLGTLIGGNSIG